MAAIDDGGPAFPVIPPLDETTGRSCSGYPYAWPGMTLRDHFAGLAMQAAATNPKGADGFTFEQRAIWAYEQADAMLAQRAAKP